MVGKYMEYRSKLFTEDNFIKWLKRDEDYVDFVDMLETNTKDRIREVLAKYLKLEEYKSIWECPHWREYLYTNRHELRFAGIASSSRYDNYIMIRLLNFSQYVKPFAYGNKEFMQTGIEIYPKSYVTPTRQYGCNTGLSVSYNIVNHSEIPFEYEIDEVYMISASGMKLVREVDLIQEDTLPHTLERYTYVTVEDNILHGVERWFNQKWKLGIKLKDKTRKKRYSAIFGIEKVAEQNRYGYGMEDEGYSDDDIMYCVSWELECLDIEDIKEYKAGDILVKNISRAKKGEKELGITIKRLGCEVTQGVFKSVKVMGDIYPIRGEQFKENFIMICSAYDDCDRKLCSQEDTIYVLNAFDFVPFRVEFSGVDAAEVKKIRITYKRLS